MSSFLNIGFFFFLATFRLFGNTPVLIICLIIKVSAGQTEFFVPVSLLQTFTRVYSCGQLAVQIVVSAIAVFRLVDNLLSSSL